MCESMVKGWKFRNLNLIDDYTLEVMIIEIDKSLSSKRVIRTLERVILDRCKPKIIRTDNRSELTKKRPLKLGKRQYD